MHLLFLRFAGSSPRRLLLWQSSQCPIQWITSSRKMHVRISTISSTENNEVIAQRWNKLRISTAGLVLSHFSQVRRVHYCFMLQLMQSDFLFALFTFTNFKFVVTGCVILPSTRHCAPALTEIYFSPVERVRNRRIRIFPQESTTWHWSLIGVSLQQKRTK